MENNKENNLIFDNKDNEQEKIESDISASFERIKETLDKYKKVVIAHDKTDKRERLINNVIGYIFEQSEKKGIEHPIVVRFEANKYRPHNRVGRVIHVGVDFIHNMDKAVRDHKHENEVVVGFVIDNIDVLASTLSTPLLEFEKYLRSEDAYKVIVVSRIFDSPVVTPYIALRHTDYNLIKISGVERSSDLSDMFYYKEGKKTRPRETIDFIYKALSKYIDLDCYNYVSEDKYIEPYIYVDENEDNLIDKALSNIKQIDEEEMNDGNKESKKLHIIICKITDKIKEKIINYNHNHVRRIDIYEYKESSMSEKRNNLYKNPFSELNRDIIIVNIETYRSINCLQSFENMRTISIINTEGFFCDIEYFMAIYAAAYVNDKEMTKNKIFGYMTSKDIEYESYCEIQDGFFKNTVFDQKKVKILYDNYLKLGNKMEMPTD